jgi:hypothetical protein
MYINFFLIINMNINLNQKTNGRMFFCFFSFYTGDHFFFPISNCIILKPVNLMKLIWQTNYHVLR